MVLCDLYFVVFVIADLTHLDHCRMSEISRGFAFRRALVPNIICGIRFSGCVFKRDLVIRVRIRNYLFGTIWYHGSNSTLQNGTKFGTMVPVLTTTSCVQVRFLWRTTVLRR